MTTNSGTPSISLLRSLAIGGLFSLFVMYALHVFGNWQLENFRRDADTTGEVIVYNKCAVFGTTHISRPNFEVLSLGDGIDKTKLFASFMNFSDGHILAMIVLFFVFGFGVFLIGKATKKTHA